MTNYTELVERLKETAHVISQYCAEDGESAELMTEAVSAISTLERENRELREALGGILEVAPHLPSLHKWAGPKGVEDRFDVGLRHRSGKKPYDYLKAWLGMLRPFAYATQDDSWGEMEKLLCIVMRNYTHVAEKSDHARATLKGSEHG